MSTLDVEAFEERAAIIEYDGGLSRFRAETLAAEAQGLTRWQAVEEIRNAKRNRNSQSRRDPHQTLARQQRENDLPGMQSASSQEVGSMSERDENARRDRLELLALQSQRLGVL